MDDGSVEEPPAAGSPKPKRVFLSYAWEEENYKLWVKRLATRLRADGVEARLDAWHLKGNDHLADFMNRELRHADWVLVICSPAYQKKVRATEDGDRVAGVAWETRLLSSKVLIDNENKVLAVLGRGDWNNAAPDGIRGQNRYDLSDESIFETNYRLLLLEITGTTEQAPPLGTLPADLEPNPPAPLRGGDIAGASSHPYKPSSLLVPSAIDVPTPSTMPVKRRPRNQLWWAAAVLVGLTVVAGSLLTLGVIHRPAASADPVTQIDNRPNSLPVIDHRDTSSPSPWTAEKDAKLADIAREYQLVSEELANFDTGLNGGVWRIELENMDRVAEYKAHRPRVVESQRLLAKAHQKCMDAMSLTDCELPDPIYHFGTVREGTSERLLFIPPPPPTLDFRVEAFCHDPATKKEAPGCPADYQQRMRKLTANASKAVLSAPAALRMNVLKSFARDAEMYFAYLDIRGRYLNVFRIVFAPEAGEEEPVTVFAPPSGMGHWERGPEPYEDNGAILTKFIMGHGDGQYRGAFLVDIKDQLGRQFKLRLAKASWSLTKGEVSLLTIDYIN